ncbi:lamina-associated polypeptide 2, isoforms alpha/zeta-like [Ranitomeya imitator]|uniref:lamina-associated polypeptide 2, isoforms alpha/zeta-like n=1 Tax=Ranitomeya imitator TaxID=111125 RepID=UPI0037E71766
MSNPASPLPESPPPATSPQQQQQQKRRQQKGHQDTSKERQRSQHSKESSTASGRKPEAENPQPGRKSVAKTKHKSCAICREDLPPTWDKRLCNTCIQQTVSENLPGFATDLKTLIKEQVEDTFRSLKSGKKRRKSKHRSPSPVSKSESDSESSMSSPSSDSSASSTSSSGGHNCFPLEDTDGLIKAVRSTMGLVDSHPKKTVQDIMFGGLEQKKRRAFPLNEAIAALIKKEWKKPVRKTLLTPKRKYPFEEESCSFWEKAPKLDVAIAKASKKFALPFEDMGVLKDPMDKKADAFLKGSWEAAGGGLKPAVAAACTSRSLMIWLNQLEGQLKGKTSRDSILNTLPVMRGAAAFLADASADSIRLSARAAVFANAARRALWLKNWPGDLQTKTKLCTIPCEGEFLFGSTLDDILEKAGDKKKSFPSLGLPSYRKPFRNKRFFRKNPGRGQGKWEDKKTKNKGFIFNKNLNDNKKPPQ